MDDAVKELLRRNRAAAAEELTALRGGADMALPELEAHLRRFILYKFQLDPAETDSDSIAEIAELSLAKTAGIARELAEQVDNAKSCDGATSAIVKKALLLTAIQNGLGITLDKKRAVRCQTVSGLAALVHEALRAAKN